MGLLSLFCFIAAFIVVGTKIALELMEDKDRSKGMPVNHEEYTIWGLFKSICRDVKNKIKNFFRRIYGKDKDNHIKEKANINVRKPYTPTLSDKANRPGYKEKDKKKKTRNKTKQRKIKY